MDPGPCFVYVHLCLYFVVHYQPFFNVLVIAVNFVSCRSCKRGQTALKSNGVKVVPNCLLMLPQSGEIRPQWRLTSNIFKIKIIKLLLLNQDYGCIALLLSCA